MRTVAKTCEFCGRTFYVRPYREKSARFCSRSCRAKWQVKFAGFGVDTRFKSGQTPWNKGLRGFVPWNKGLKGIRLSPKGPPVLRGRDNPRWKEPVQRICKNCGKVFYKKPWELKPRQHGARGIFCSNKCKNEFHVKSGHLKNMSRKARLPSKPEVRFAKLCEKYRLPFRYVGDGRSWVGEVNPDFVWEDKKVAVEIMSRYHHSFFKLFRYGRILPWIKTPAGRKEYLEKHGWKVVILYDNFTEEEALKEVLKYCPIQRLLLGGELK